MPIPTPHEVIEAIASQVLGFGDMDFDEADYRGGNGTMELYGTYKGQTFGCVVTVSGIEYTDF